MSETLSKNHGGGDADTAEDTDELAATLQAILRIDCLTLKSYARAVLFSTDDGQKKKKDEIKKIEHQLLDLARAIHESGELLFDLPLALITTKICPFLPTRTDWNNFLCIKTSLRTFTKTAPMGVFSPPWPRFPRPSKTIHLEPEELNLHQYRISSDGQWLAFTEAPPARQRAYIHVYSRKNGPVTSLCSPGPFPFCVFHFQQQYEKIDNIDDIRASDEQVVDASTITTDSSGNMMRTTTFVQAMDTHGIYLEWQIFPTRHEHVMKGPKPRTVWIQTQFGSDNEFHAKSSNFSHDGKYLVRLVGDNEIVVQHVEKEGKIVLHHKKSKIKRIAYVVMSRNNKLLALASARRAGPNDGSTLMEVCEILEHRVTGDGDGYSDHLEVGRVLSYVDSSIDVAVAPLAFSPDSTKLASMLPSSPDKIAIWDTSMRAMSSASTTCLFLPLLNTVGTSMKLIVGRIQFSANGKLLIIKAVHGKVFGDLASMAELYNGNVEIWSIEDNQRLHSFPGRSLEAVSRCIDANGDRTFILMEERQELKPPITFSGTLRQRSDNLEKTIQVLEVDAMVRLLTYIHPKKGRCVNCNKREDELLGNKALLRCTRCKEVAYCSRECQKADWKVHKRSCNIPQVE